MTRIKKTEIERFFTTLSENTENEKYIKIPIGNYSELGFMIENIIGVCGTAIYAINEQEQMTKTEKEDFFGVGLSEIFNVLKLAQKLIPHSELEFLDILNTSQNEND